MLKVYIDGKDSEPPLEYRGIEIGLNLENEDEIQASITQEKFTFVNANADLLNGIITQGIGGGYGVFSGVPFRLELGSLQIFNGYIDLTNEAEFSCDKVIAKVRENKGGDWFQEIADGFGFDYLYSIGVITDADFIKVPYIVSEIPNYRDMALLSIYSFVLIKEIRDLIKEWGKVLADFGGVFNAGGGALKVIVLVVYTAAVFVAMLKLIKELLALLIQPVKYHLGMMISRIFEVFCTHLGYTFSSSIFQASTPSYNELASGLYADEVIIPEKSKEGFKKNKTTDQVGYPNGTIGDFVRGMNAKFNAKFIIKDNLFQFERVDYKNNTSTYKIPDVRRDFNGLNTDEIVSNYLVQYQIDSLDLNTVNRYDGTNAKNVTISKVQRPGGSDLIKGFKQPAIPYARGLRKNVLTEVEVLFQDILTVVDKLLNPVYDIIAVVKKGVAGFIKVMNVVIKALNALPGVNLNTISVPSTNVNKLNLSGLISNRIGMMALSGDLIGVQKVVMVEGSGWDVKIRSDNDTFLSAENLWNRFHYIESMCPSTSKPNANQMYVYDIPIIPFCKSDFLLIKNGANIVSPEGNPCKLLALKWNFWDNKASIRYAEEKIYTNNLQETLLINTGE